MFEGKKIYKIWQLSLSLFVVTMVFLPIFVLSLTKSVNASWFNDQWAYRQKISITGNSSAATDFQVQLSINTQTLYTAGKLQPHCEDLRFTDGEGNLLEYWVEDTVTPCFAATNQIIWVRVPSLLANGTDIYMYYGNRLAERAENPYKTFDFFDDFEYTAWYNNAWRFRIPIRINNEKLQGTLTNFPVYIDLSTLGKDFFDRVKADGTDIVVTNSDGTTKLDRELVSLNMADRTGVLWVRVPTLANSADKYVYVYFGNAAASEVNTSSVWNSNYVIMQHMENNPAGSAPQMLDSTANGNNGTSNGAMPSSALIKGKIGKALAFDGSNDYIAIPHSSSQEHQTITFSVWARSKPTTWNANGPVLSKRSVSFGTTEYIIHPDPDGRDIKVYVSTASTWRFVNNTPANIQEWNHYVGTYDGSTLRYYVNGTFVGSASAPGARNLNATPLNIGADFCNACGSRFLFGDIDEVRTMNVAASADWVAVEYNNQNDPASFYKVLPIESPEGLNAKLVRWEMSGTPQFSGSSMSLTNSAKLRTIQQFPIGKRFMTRLTQQSTSLATALAGFSNSALGSEFTADDSAFLNFDSSTTLEETGVSDEGAVSIATYGTEPTSARATIGTLVASTYFRVATGNSTATTNRPNEAMNVRFENNSAGETLTVDHVMVGNFTFAFVDSGSAGSEEKSIAPIVHWKLDETEGQIYKSSGILPGYDMMRGGTLAVENGDPANRENCVVGNCAQFNSGHAAFIDKALPAKNNATISLWMYTNRITPTIRQTILSAGEANSTGVTLVLPSQSETSANPNKLRFYVRTSTAWTFCDSTTSIIPQQWHYVTTTYAHPNVNIYINGRLDASCIIAGNYLAPTSSMALGSFNSLNQYYLNGMLDDVKIYDYVRTQQQINNEYSSFANVLGTSTDRREDGLSAWWKFEEISGTSVVDNGTGRVNGTSSGPTLGNTGIFGKSYLFDGINDTISVPATAALDTQFLTISAWINAASYDQQGNIFVKTTNGSDNTQYLLYFGNADNGYLNFRTVNASAVQDTLALDVSSSGLIPNQWNHVVAVYDGQEKAIYVNGEKKVSAPYSQTLAVNAAGISRIGSLASSYYFSGRIDELRVYNKGMSLQEVESLYRERPEPVGYFEFNERIGLTAYDNFARNPSMSFSVWKPFQWGNGVVGGSARVYDGAYISQTACTFCQVARDSFSLAFWAKVEDGASVVIPLIEKMANQGGGSELEGYTFSLLDDGGIRAGIRQDVSSSTTSITDYNTSVEYDDGQWHHFAMAIDRNSLEQKIFVDGTLIGNTSLSGFTQSIQNPGNFYIGTNSAVTDFGDFHIDSFRFYDYALTEQEVSAIKNQQVLGQSSGSGNATVSASVNISTDIIADGRTSADGEAFAVSAIDGNTITVTGTGTDGTTAATLGNAVTIGDLVLLINMQGDGTNYSNVGSYEFCRVQSVAGAVIACTAPISKVYGASSNSSLSGQKVMVQRVPEFENLTVTSSGVLTANAWNGTLGGIFAVIASGDVTVESGGSITMSAKGYTAATDWQCNFPYQGDSYTGIGIKSNVANNGGGGAGRNENCTDNWAGGAGGGGYGTSGSSGSAGSGGGTAGTGGGTYGDTQLTKLFMGSAGGTGGGDGWESSQINGQNGGSGGGIVFVQSGGNISVNAGITSNGQTRGNGDYAGAGGGAGGSIYLRANTMNIGSSLVSAVGGNGSVSGSSRGNGGNGGVGRIRLDALTVTGTSSPTPGYTGNTNQSMINSLALSTVKTQKETRITANLQGEWLFDERSGVTARDTTANGSHATFVNITDTNWVLGNIGRGISLNGVDQYATVPNASHFNSTDWTISAWVKTTQTSMGRIIVKEGNTPGQQRFSLGVNVVTLGKAEVRFDGGTFNTATSTTNVNDGKWHHVVGTFNDASNRLRIYVDGRLEQQTTTAQTPTASANDINIGRFSAAGQYLQGSIDQIRYWNTELTPRDVAMEYNQGLPFAWWRFDEGQSTIVKDFSGRGNHGTLTNMDPVTDWLTGTDCKRNSCLDFDGTNDHILVANESQFDFERTREFSVCTWFRPDQIASTSHTLVSKLSSGNVGWELTAYDGTAASDGILVYLINSWPGNRISVAYDNVLQANQWHHICFAYNGSSAASGVAIYLNGVLLTSPVVQISTLSGSILNNEPLRIGSRQSNVLPADGRIDEVKVFNYRLTQEDILIDYNMGAALRFE